MHSILFNIFGTLALTAAIGVIFAKNPIHSVICLILVFCNATGLLLLYKIELLAMMFIIIYVGAIAVLFLFVVMMLNIKINQPTAYKIEGIGSRTDNIKMPLAIKGIYQIVNTPITKGGITAIIIMLSISTLVDIPQITEGLWGGTNGKEMSGAVEEMKNIWGIYNEQTKEKPWTLIAVPTTNIQTLGYLIYTHYVYHFVVASIILMIAMIGAIVLTMYKKTGKQASKKQEIYKQVARKFENAVTLTK